jgi:hypothetical protein
VPPKLVDTAQKFLSASATRRLLIVEGPTDEAVYVRWFEKLDPLFQARLEIVNAESSGGGGGKIQVLNCLQWFADRGGEPRLFGLVDRDEWHLTTIADQCTRLVQLRINPDRHAVESYFCDPDELEPALLRMDPTWAALLPALRHRVSSALPLYADHWALLTITDRLKVRMAVGGYPGHFSTTIPVPPDADIQARFALWATTLDPVAAFQDFDNLRTTARAASEGQRCRSHVWAKMFFEDVVYPAPGGLAALRPRNRANWLLDLAEAFPSVPADLAGLLQPLLA